MSLRLYMDHHVHQAITLGLRGRGVDVLTAEEDGSASLADPDLLDRATRLGRVLVSQDADLPAEATRRMRSGINFGGLIYGSRLSGSIAQTIDDLELIAAALDPDPSANTIIFLPL